jgi:hypothetical protein
LRAELADARTLPLHAARSKLLEVEGKLGPLGDVETGVVVDLLLSYRAVKAFNDMAALFERMPEVLRRTTLVREQLAFALNRIAGAEPEPERKRLRERAIRTLQELIAERGPSSETCGLLGRIYKDLWDETRALSPQKARGYLKEAILQYKRGFEADWRDAYPGINAATLLDVEGSPASIAERDRLIPVVRFATEQRVRGRTPDYWDHSALLELAVLAGEEGVADEKVADALASQREAWQLDSTARNLSLIREARAARLENTSWLERIVAALRAAAAEIA